MHYFLSAFPPGQGNPHVIRTWGRTSRRPGIFLLIAGFFIVGLSTLIAQPTITMRFANPTYNCTTRLYCVDVEMKSNQANTEVFGMNIRFLYDNGLLQFNSYTSWQGGYGATSPNPPSISTSPTFGTNMGFPGGVDYFNGGMEKVNASAPAIYLSTTGWTKLFSMCFTVNSGYPTMANFCPPLVWDLELNPANGGYFGNDGVVVTVITGAGSTGPSTENVDQFNWQYTGSGSAPYGAPFEEHCIDITCGQSCELTVTTTADVGVGTLRNAIICAPSGSTILFSSALAGQTINLTSLKIVVGKTLNIFNNNATRINITASALTQLFEVDAGKTVHFKGFNITGGIGEAGTNNNGGAFQNYGIIKLENADVFRHASMSSTKYLIRNFAGSQLVPVGTTPVRIEY